MFRVLLFINLFLVGFVIQVNAQNFSHQDTLRGLITPERAWWDLIYYHLNISLNPADSSIIGENKVVYKVIDEYDVMQIDLQAPLKITKALQNGKQLKITDDGNAHFIHMEKKQIPGETNQVVIFYHGQPKIANRPPWDGGITWSTDKNQNPFIASSCQGIGASIWWPCKDHMYDEVDSMLISVNVPKGLMDVSNGRLRKTEMMPDSSRTFYWFVSNPINNYGVNINIGEYVHFSEQYDGEKGLLDCDYYVLPYHLEKAKVQFKDASRMLKAFEYWFGPYPFYEDSYKLVEAPYLGMEHQSSITYGNGFKNGYNGTDLSGTGWGLKFDFIIIHESGHEWFANNITYKDIADMWIHESFTNYSESLFIEYYYGKKAASEYVIGTRKRILNDKPIIGFYNVNNTGSTDMYYKGGNMLHTLRQIVNNDEKWRDILRGLNKEFYHHTVTTRQIEDYLSEKTGFNLKPFFDQYLRSTQIPELEYYSINKKFYYRWANCVDDFSIPVKVKIGEVEFWLKPTPQWKKMKLKIKNPLIAVNPNFYVGSKEIVKKTGIK